MNILKQRTVRIDGQLRLKQQEPTYGSDTMYQEYCRNTWYLFTDKAHNLILRPGVVTAGMSLRPCFD